MIAINGTDSTVDIVESSDPHASVAGGNVMPEVARRPVPVRPYSARIKPLERTAAVPQVDLRPRISALGLDIRDQGGRGTCSIFAMTFLLEYLYATRMIGVPRDLSEEYLNFVTDSVSGERRDGDFFHNVDAGYQAWGIVPEALLPYAAAPVPSVPENVREHGRRWTRFQVEFIKPWDANQGVTQAQLDRAMSSLDAEIPVGCGGWWPTSGNWSTTTVKGVETMSVPSVAQKNVTLADGHSVALVGYRRDSGFPGGGYFVFRNSWRNADGTPWGDDGYGYMPFEYLRRFTNDLVIYDTQRITGARLGAKAAVCRRTKIDVVAADSSDEVHAGAWEEGVHDGRWRAWWSILNGRLRSNSTPSLVARDAARLDVFGVGSNGGIYTAAWDPRVEDAQWRGWWRILDATASEEANVCALARDSDKLDVFTIGKGGEILTAAWDQNVDGAQWRGWWRISNGAARARNGVTAVARDKNKLDVFVVGASGRVATAAWDPTVDRGRWRGWWHIGDAHPSDSSNVSVVSRDSHKLDAFIVGRDGGIYTAAWDQDVSDGRWRGWWRITNGVASAESEVCAVSREAGKLDVFMVGADRGIYTAAWDQDVDNAKWRGWWRVGNLTASPKGGLAAISREAGSLDLFATGRDGRVYTAAWDQAIGDAKWRGWWRIDP